MSVHDLHGQRLHERALELASTAVDFALTPAEAGELEAHLATCPTCTRRASALRADAWALSRPLTLLPASGVDDAVYAAIARRQSRPLRPALLAAAALLLLALLGAAAVGAYLLRNQPTLPTTIVPQPTAPVALVTPGPDASPSRSASPTTLPATPSVRDVVPTVAPVPAPGTAAGLTWTLGHTDPNAYGSQIAYGPAGWMHVVNPRQQPAGPRVMLSADLRTWSDVTPKGSRVGCVALSATNTTYLSLCEGLMRSSDGRTWETVGDPPVSDGTFKGGAKQFYSDGTTFLATTGGYPSSSVIWTSPDGARWTAIHLPGAPRVIIDAVVGRSSGGYIIAGRAADTEAEFDARSLPVWYKNPGRQAMWTSTDGATWTSVPLGHVFDGARITGLAVDGPGGGIVAVGHVGEVTEGTSVVLGVWRAADGVTWQHFTGSAFDLREGDVGEARVIGLADRWLVFASRPRAVGMTGTGVAAGSEDGTDWWSTDPIWGAGPSPYTITGLNSMNVRLVALDDTLVDSATVDPSARIWVSP